MKKNHSAFSLVELSIVILIIGILVTGITQSSRLVKQFRLSTAQSLTQSSPVASIKNLTLWLETSNEESLVNADGNNEFEDDTEVVIWKDFNPQSTQKLIFTNSENFPAYSENGINKLPSINFTAADSDCLKSSVTPIGAGDDSYTIFAVWQRRDIGASGSIIASQDANSGGDNELASFLLLDGNYGFSGGANDFGEVATAEGVTYISAVKIDNNKEENVSLYTNSTTPISGTSTNEGSSMSISNQVFTIGCRDVSGAQNYDGLISEIIVFDRTLKNEEISSIFTYLGKKYSVTIN